MIEHEPQTSADFLLGIYDEEIAGEIYNLIHECAMLGVTLGIVTQEEAQAHLEKLQGELFTQSPAQNDNED